jgi:hypothetical protein
MTCFECKEKIKDESNITHIGDGDFVHNSCKEIFEENKNKFFKDIEDGNEILYFPLLIL